MLKRLGFSACLLLLTLISFAPGRAVAAGRVALVIGNSDYRSVPQLPNPTNDAADVAASLGRLGFSVDLMKNAGFDDLRRALISFGAKARDADFAVIYFAGHGLELAGEDWVIPVDAALSADRDVENEAIGLKALTLAVSGTRSLGLIVLDACRNNPFDTRMQHATRSRSVSRGLAPIEPTGNVLVAFAAKDGTTATDGDGRNSPFTAALLNHLETPGLEVDFLLRNVRDDVLAATKGQQQPFAYGSLSREAVYLQPALATASSGTTLQAAPAADDIAWPFLATTTDPALVRRFTSQFPESRHRAEADQRLAVLEAASTTPLSPIHASTSLSAEDVKQASQTTTAETATPEQGAVARQLKANSPQVEAAWSLVKASADPALLKRFTAEFPSRERKTVAAALNGIDGSAGVLRQLRAEEMHAVLADYGRFAQHQRYGEVWVPTVVPVGWHPYEPCHWVKTRDFDWFYLDRTAWGAIVHHFGRWVHDDQLGWVWVPGVDFSPGWVTWRATSQQIGWAPLPPADDVHTIAAAQLDSADFWTFMDSADFTRGCGAAIAAAPLLTSAAFVRELKIVGGLPVSVLPFALPDRSIDVNVAFDPWPAGLVSQAMVDLNRLWSSAPGLCPAATGVPVKARDPDPLVVPISRPGKALLKEKSPQQAAKRTPPPAPTVVVPLRRPAPTVYQRNDPVVAYPRVRSYYPEAAARQLPLADLPPRRRALPPYRQAEPDPAFQFQQNYPRAPARPFYPTRSGNGGFGWANPDRGSGRADVGVRSTEPSEAITARGMTGFGARQRGYRRDERGWGMNAGVGGMSIGGRSGGAGPGFGGYGSPLK